MSQPTFRQSSTLTGIARVAALLDSVIAFRDLVKAGPMLEDVRPCPAPYRYRARGYSASAPREIASDFPGQAGDQLVSGATARTNGGGGEAGVPTSQVTVTIKTWEERINDELPPFVVVVSELWGGLGLSDEQMWALWEAGRDMEVDLTCGRAPKRFIEDTGYRGPFFCAQPTADPAAAENAALRAERRNLERRIALTDLVDRLVEVASDRLKALVGQLPPSAQDQTLEAARAALAHAVATSPDANTPDHPAPGTMASVLAVGVPAPEAGGSRPETAPLAPPTRPSRRPPRENDARDRFIYEMLMKDQQTKYDAQLAALRQAAEQHGWDTLESPQALRQAAMRYASRNDLPPIPRRLDQ
jgi:hypothetical protein